MVYILDGSELCFLFVAGSNSNLFLKTFYINRELYFVGIKMCENRWCLILNMMILLLLLLCWYRTNEKSAYQTISRRGRRGSFNNARKMYEDQINQRRVKQFMKGINIIQDEEQLMELSKSCDSSTRKLLQPNLFCLNEPLVLNEQLVSVSPPPPPSFVRSFLTWIFHASFKVSISTIKINLNWKLI